MKTLVLVAALATFPAGQGADQVTGSWTAAFKGETFIRLELRAERGTLGGTLSTGNIEVDTQGNLLRVTPAPADLKAVLDVVQQGSTVTFSRKDADGTERFEFRVVDVGRAELRFLFNDEVREELAVGGIPLPKPVALTRR